MKDQNFEIVAAAQDTGGLEAAGKFYERAEATFTTLIDREHTVSRLYNMVNVPTGVWIDEEGRIVRPNEVAYSKDISFLTMSVNGDAYVAALRDWVARGPESEYALTPEEIAERVAPRSREEALADAYFQLGVYFHQTDQAEKEAAAFAKAQELRPESWNYHRQQWSFTPSDAMKKWMAKYRGLGEQPYYAPLELDPQG